MPALKIIIYRFNVIVVHLKGGKKKKVGEIRTTIRVIIRWYNLVDLSW